MASLLARSLAKIFQPALRRMLLAAVREGKPEKASAVASWGADPNGWLPGGFTALTANHMRSDPSCAAMARTLQAAGADPNLANGYGMRPLHYAAVFCLSESCQALLDGGADPELPNREGLAPMEHLRSMAQRSGDRFDANKMGLIESLLEAAALRSASAEPAASARRSARL